MDYAEKIKQLDNDIIWAVDNNLELATKKSGTKKSIQTLLTNREQKEASYKEEKNQYLIEDAVYDAAQKAGDGEVMEAIRGRKLTKQQYQEFSEKYWVNVNAVEYDPENEEEIISLQNEIMERAKKWTKHHQDRLQKKTNELVKNEDKTGLEQLNKWIDFDNWKLILKTKLGDLKFAPKQATYHDIKHIDWIKKDKNVWTENKESKKSWLRANHEAVMKMKNAGKKICSDEQFLAAANVFPGWDELSSGNRSTKAKDFFDLLGADQYGFRGPGGRWDGFYRRLWSSSASWVNACHMNCVGTKGGLHRDSQYYGLGVWFLED